MLSCASLEAMRTSFKKQANIAYSSQFIRKQLVIALLFFVRDVNFIGDDSRNRIRHDLYHHNVDLGQQQIDADEPIKP
jgi:hypothetical protein